MIRELSNLTYTNNTNFNTSNPNLNHNTNTSNNINGREVRKQESDVVESTISSLTSFDMWAIGITIVIGGQYFAWNETLTSGVGSTLIALCLTTIGYVCLVYCVAELSSGLPFAGGNYGLARVTAGIFPGYLVGCYDALETIIYVATSVVSIGSMITSVSGTSSSYEPLYWLVFYISAISIHSYGGVFFWRLNIVIAVVSFVIIVMYILGSSKWGNFDKYAIGDGYGDWFRGGGMEFMRQLYIPCWFYVGVEGINIACQDVPNPKVNIPKGYISCLWSLFGTAFGVFFVCISLPPGSNQTAEELWPLNAGFRLSLHLKAEHADLLALPALYGTAFGFMFFYGRQLRAMGNSGLINPFFGASLPGPKTPFRGLVLGSLIGYCICLVCFFFPVVSSHLFQLCILCASVVYFSQFASYIVFNTLLRNIKREFYSPLGIPGAIIGSLIYFLMVLSIIFFQKDQYTLIAFVVYTILCTIYYYLVVKDRQFFSTEEKTVLMAAHVVKNNMKKNAKRKRKPNRWQQIAAKIHAMPSSDMAENMSSSNIGSGMLSRNSSAKISIGGDHEHELDYKHRPNSQFNVPFSVDNDEKYSIHEEEEEENISISPEGFGDTDLATIAQIPASELPAEIQSSTRIQPLEIINTLVLVTQSSMGYNKLSGRQSTTQTIRKVLVKDAQLRSFSENDETIC
mmetsp:Transcript_9768/g.10269  ORF Transcript_9768/g.10269 Transcript_9768/m.10269 type:complete len:683 (-) Transcript_9768:167-2215(-)